MSHISSRRSGLRSAVIFTNGAVFDGKTFLPAGTDVRVVGNHIVEVGPNLDRAGAGVVDLRGGTLLPGFIDAHVHPVFAGCQMLRCDLGPVRTADEYPSAIRRYALAHPQADWIVGGGWSLTDFPRGAPSRHILDAIVAERPAYFINRDAHSAWVNTAALRAAGIDETTPDPADGRIERDASGRPIGTLHDGAAELVARLIPRYSDSELRRALDLAQRVLIGYGITGWQDAIVGDYMGFDDPFRTYLDAALDGSLIARVVGAQWWNRKRGAEQLDELRDRRAAAQTDLFTAGTVKMMVDGVPETQTAAMLDPYLGDAGSRTDDTGIELIGPDDLKRYVARLDSDGFQIHFHAVGDKAVRNALDAVEYARAANGEPRQTHHIAHAQVIHPDDIARFARLRVAANLQFDWASHNQQMDQMTIPKLGDTRAAMQYPFLSLHEARTHLCAGSDWPVSTPDPLQGVHVSANRSTTVGASAAQFIAAEATDRRVALSAYTSGSAHINGCGDSAGRIRPGFSGDFAVVDQDLHHIPAPEIGTAHVTQTWISGDLVYERD